MTLLVDPPSGWRYGFPKPYDKEKGLEQMLREVGYPEKDIPLALNHSRYIGEYEELMEHKKETDEKTLKTS